jgi:hypothetical protein
MKRITILLDDWLYRGLLEYAADSSKRDIERMSLSRVVRDLLAGQLRTLGYPHSRVPGTLSEEQRSKLTTHENILVPGKDTKITK